MNFRWVTDNVAVASQPETDDDSKILKTNGVNILVRLLEEYEAKLSVSKISPFVTRVLEFPIKELSLPNMTTIRTIVRYIEQYVSYGWKVCISCNKGIGRSGLILACYLKSRGWSTERALKEVELSPERIEAVREYVP